MQETQTGEGEDKEEAASLAEVLLKMSCIWGGYGYPLSCLRVVTLWASGLVTLAELNVHDDAQDRLPSATRRRSVRRLVGEAAVYSA